jgi:hypothetical protein
MLGLKRQNVGKKPEPEIVPVLDQSKMDHPVLGEMKDTLMIRY